MHETFAKLTVSQQLVRKMQAQIEKGIWKAGDSMPSLRSLADRYGVSLNTVQKAVRELTAMDLIEQQPGQSGIVKFTPPRRPAAHHQVAWVEGFDPEAGDNYWGEGIMHSARGILAEAGFRVTVITFNIKLPDPVAQVMRLLEPIIDHIAGLFCPAAYGLTRILDYVEQKGLPWMTVTPLSASITHNFVTADNLGGGRMAGRCFARLGLQRLAMLHIGLNELSPQNKAAGLCQGYLERELPPPSMELIRCRNQEERAGYEAMRNYLKTHQPPQGLFAIGDLLAVGAIRACQEVGLRVPEEISVIGSTGIPANRLVFSPSLAAVAQPVRQMGEQVGSGLVHMIREGIPKVAGRYIPCHFIPGHSFNAPIELQDRWARGSETSVDNAAAPADAGAAQSPLPVEVPHEPLTSSH